MIRGTMLIYDILKQKLERGRIYPTSEFPLQRLKSLRDVADSHVSFVVIQSGHSLVGRIDNENSAHYSKWKH